MRKNRNTKPNRNSYKTLSKNFKYVKTFESFGCEYELLLEEENLNLLAATALMVLANSPSFANSSVKPNVNNIENTIFVTNDQQEVIVSDTLWDEQKMNFVRSISLGTESARIEIKISDEFTGPITVIRSNLSKYMTTDLQNLQSIYCVYTAKNKRMSTDSSKVFYQQQFDEDKHKMRKDVAPYYTITDGRIEEYDDYHTYGKRKMQAIRGGDASGKIGIEFDPGDRSETKPLLTPAGNSRDLEISLNISAYEDSEVVVIYRGQTIQLDSNQHGQPQTFRHINRSFTPKHK